MTARFLVHYTDPVQAPGKGLPVRGQRTSTNARTRKGPRKAAVAKKKAPGKK